MLQVVLENATVRRVVIDDQRTNAVQLHFPRHGACAAQFQRDAHGEHRTLAGLRPRPDRATHRVDQLLRDGEAEAGAAETARRRAVGLRERFEEACCRLAASCRCRCPAPPSHLHGADRTHRRPMRSEGTLNPMNTSPLLREFDGIADEVGQDLAQPRRVAAHDAPARRCAIAHESSTPFGAAPAGEERRDVLGDRRAGRTSMCSSVSLPASIFEKSRMSLMRVEQRIAPSRATVSAYSRCVAGRARVVEQQLEHADDAVHRRADLVAHVGEERALGAARFFRPGLLDFETAGIFLQLPLGVGALLGHGGERLAELADLIRGQRRQLERTAGAELRNRTSQLLDGRRDPARSDEPGDEGEQEAQKTPANEQPHGDAGGPKHLVVQRRVFEHDRSDGGGVRITHWDDDLTNIPAVDVLDERAGPAVRHRSRDLAAGIGKYFSNLIGLGIRYGEQLAIEHDDVPLVAPVHSADVVLEKLAISQHLPGRALRGRS